VLDANKRKAYLARIDALAAHARQATATTDSAPEKAELLLKWLHGGALKADGYQKLDSDLGTVLYKGTFNCLSSAVLYNILGRRLGLDLRAVIEPGQEGHAYSVLYDGGRGLKVETTDGRGFNAQRKPAKGQREVGEVGLVAAIYTNEAGERLREKRYLEAVRAAFGAVGVTSDRLTLTNTRAAFNAWSDALVAAKRYEGAVTVATAGLRFAPDDGDMKRIAAARWNDWAMTFAKSKNPDWTRAKRILERGLAEVPAETLRHNIKVCEERLRLQGR
jgi:hypothetical protein